MANSTIIIEESNDESWDTYQPEATLSVLNECIQIRFTKKAADAVNIYRRQSANESWEFIATGVNSPFDDYELAQYSEYCIRGVKENKEVGIPLFLFIDAARD